MFKFFKNISSKFHQRNGFTLVELMIVISIITVMSLTGTVVLGKPQKHSRDQKRVRDLNSISQAIELYFRDNNTYPGNVGFVYVSTDSQPWISGPGNPVVPTYMASLPIDPLNSGSYVYWYFPLISVSPTQSPSCSGIPLKIISYALIATMESDQPTGSYYGCMNNSFSLNITSPTSGTYWYIVTPQ